MDWAHNNNITMGVLQQALPKKEDLQFHKAIQCTICQNPNHSNQECTMWTHCALCHSRAHMIARCEYNLLNHQAVLVCHIEPSEDGQPEGEQIWREDRYRPKGRFQYEDNWRRDKYPRDRRLGIERRYQERKGYYNPWRNNNPRRGNHNRWNEHRDQEQDCRRNQDNWNIVEGGHRAKMTEGSGVGTPSNRKRRTKGIREVVLMREEGHYSNQCPV